MVGKRCVLHQSQPMAKQLLLLWDFALSQQLCTDNDNAVRSYDLNCAQPVQFLRLCHPQPQTMASVGSVSMHPSLLEHEGRV